MPAPHRVVLRMNRAARAGDPLAGQAVTTQYIRQLPDALVEVAELDWPKLLPDLGVLASTRPDPQAARRIGAELQAFLGQLPSWARDLGAGLEAMGSGRPLELVLSFDAAELYAVPWELTVPSALRRRLGEDPRVRFRYEWPGAHPVMEQPHPRPAGERVLLAWSAAGGRVPWQEHRDAIFAAAHEGYQDFDPARDVLGQASIEAITARLTEGLASERGAYAALHLLCHGSARDGAFGLMLDEARGRSHGELVNPERLRSSLAPLAPSLRLVVLSACHSGGSTPFGNRLGSLAQALHVEGIEAVVASRLPLSVPGSVVITEALYHTLMVAPGSVEDAVAAARTAATSRAPSAEGLDWAALQLYAAQPPAGDLRPLVLRPYRGLLAFSARHSRFFFGRGPEAALLHERIREAAAGTRPRLQVLSGASGSGKSSLVLAGVVPRLLSPGADDPWDVVTIRPSDHGGGLASLQRSLRALRGNTRRGPSPVRELHQKPSRGDLVREALLLGRDHPAWVLVVLDQTEEVFTQLDRPAREELMGAVWELSRLDGARLVFLATIRVDFLGQSGDVVLDERGTRLDRVTFDPAHTFGVSQVDLRQITSIIEGPAAAVGLRFEEDLVADILGELGREVAALPLLEYALDEIWKRREGALLTRRAYQELGGFRGALARTADRVLAEMSPGEVAQTRLLLVQAVLAGGSIGADTRRRVWLGELRRDEAQQARDLDTAVARLVASRLLVQGDDDPGNPGSRLWVEVAHEALIRSWDTLRGWIAEDRRMYEQLETLDSSWRAWERARCEGGDAPSFLLQGGALVLAQEALTAWEHAMRQPVRDYVQHSLDERDRRLRVRQVRSRRFALAMALVAVVMMGVSLFAWSKKQEADQQKQVAVLRQEEVEQKRDELAKQTAALKAKQAALVEQTDLANANARLADEKTVEAQAAAERAEVETARAIEALQLAGVDPVSFERAARFELPMRAFEPGSFTMGSPHEEAGREPDEVPHPVSITRPFEIGATEVTQLEWAVVMGTRPFQFKGMADRPAEMVSWYDALAFCNALSRKRGLQVCYDIGASEVVWADELDCEGFRLPTEAEWEYAARGHGRAGMYPVAGDFTDLETSIREGGATADAYSRAMLGLAAWYHENSGGGTHPVGAKLPNGDGLYDTLGNVWEWVWDLYGPYPIDGAVDPLGATEGSMRVARGGSWWYRPAPRLATRGVAAPQEQQDGIGFRVARTLER